MFLVVSSVRRRRFIDLASALISLPSQNVIKSEGDQGQKNEGVDVGSEISVLLLFLLYLM